MQTMEWKRSAAGYRVLAIAVLIGGAGVTGCESDPVDLEDHEEGDVAGFRIDAVDLQLPGGVTRTTLFTYDGPANADTLSLRDGTTIDIEIVWLDADGHELELDADEHPWELAENHSAIVSFVPSDTEPWRGTFTTTPLLPGATVYGGFTVTLFHGEDPEFETSQLVAAVEGD